MESSLKLHKMLLRKLVQDGLLFVWLKQEANEEKRKVYSETEFNIEFIDELSVLIWIESYRTELRWQDFFKNHFKRMTSTPYLFANYVAYACYLSNICVTDAFESCYISLSLVIHFVLHCWKKEREEFFNSCVDLFCAFFEKEILTKFEDQGGWMNFVDYIADLKTIKQHNELVSASQHVSELFKGFQCRNLGSGEPYDINGIVLKDIAAIQVESHQESVVFAESVDDKMKELCGKTFVDVLTDFGKTDRQLKEMFEASGEMSEGGEQASLQDAREEASVNIVSTTKSEKKKHDIKTETASDLLITQNLNTIKFQDRVVSVQTSHLKPKSRKSERYEKLLSDLSMDVAKLSELSKILCDKNGVGVEIQVVDTDNNV